MAESSTVARPYAVAAFRHAKARGELRAWSGMLELAAAVVGSPQVAEVLADPLQARHRTTEWVASMCAEHLSMEALNFLRVLGESGRLSLLPDVRRQFEALRRESESRVEVELVSAYPLSQRQEGELASAMQGRLQREVQVRSRVDRFLLGGVVVRVGDQVIDASVRGRLQRLGHVLAR